MSERTVGERFAWQFAALTAAFVPMTIAALAVDARMVNDISVWIKPLKFEFSIALHLVTLAVLVRVLPSEKRSARWLSIVLATISVAGFAEISMITMQSMRGVGSHFNTSSPFDGGVYAMMGVGALLLTLPVIAIGARFATLPAAGRLTPGLKLGAALGLIVGASLTFLIAGYLSMQPSGHWIGGLPTDANGLPVTGWSRDGGDLRVSHFIATHMIQIMPFVGWIADRQCAQSSAWPKRIVWIALLVSVAAVAGTFVQAMSGLPLI